MSRRKTITDRMKWQSLIFWSGVRCAECGGRLHPTDAIEWDHRQALIHDGAHHYENIRAVHEECHKGKTKRDIQANAKVKRITGETGTRAEKFAVAKKPLDEPREKSSGFTKRPTRPFKRQEGNVRQIHETRGE